MGKTTLTWKYDGLVGDGFRIYRAGSPMDPENLPLPIATVGIEDREYVDETVVAGETYYYRVASYLGDTERISEEIEHIAKKSSDPYWANVVSLLHFDGDFTDETGKVWEPTGVPSITSVNPAFGSGSVEKRGGTGFLLTRNSDDFIFPDDFTIEAWILTDAGAGHTMLISYVDYINELLPLYLDNSSSGRVFWKGSNAITGLVLPVGEWFHYALTRESGVLRAFVNGVLKGSATRNDTVGMAGGVQLLGDGVTYPGWRGQLDEFRITKGVARYTENFTPPAEPFPDF